MKILGIGNAIVDVICKVDENFISENALTKGTMKLIFDKNEFQTLMADLKIEKTISGGSVANSIVGLSQLGNKVGFVGKVSDDKLGSKYPSKKTILLLFIVSKEMSSSLIFPAVPKKVHIVLSESGVTRIKQVPVGRSSFFFKQ